MPVLPSDWKWDTSVKDFESLKQNVERLRQRKEGGIPTFTMLGGIEKVRRTFSRDFVQRQHPNGLCFDAVDTFKLQHTGYMPLHELLIRQRDYLSECIHLREIPPYALAFAEPLMQSPAAITRWIETLDWRWPWGVGNIDMDTAYELAFEWKVRGNEKAHETLRAWFDWHDKNADPETGFWDLANTGNMEQMMAGAMHQFGIYFMFNHDLPNPEGSVRGTLTLQEDTGLFCRETYSHNCLDIDSVFILANVYNKYGVMEREIKSALERAFEANLKCFHPAGGAVSRVGVDKNPDWWSTWCRVAITGWCARILNISEFQGNWEFRPRHPFVSEDGGASLPDWESDEWLDAADWPTLSPVTA